MLLFLRNTRWAILWGVFIFVLTGLPGSVLPKLPSYFDLFQPDKLAHLVVFAVFFFLSARSFYLPGTPSCIAKYPVLYAFLVCLFVAGATELMQEFIVPMRTGSVWDFIANMVGCFAGWGVSVWIRRRRKDVGRRT
ncbi:MAG: VanZ family protein [Bacteroidales bacterium]|nr:VanZ family protein [Bacteroidales bacterium]